MPASLRHRLGALVYDWPRFLAHIRGNWTLIRNHDETIATDSRGVLCQWDFTSDLHVANVYPLTGRWLMCRAFGDWPIALGERQTNVSERPQVSFLIGHRGIARLSHLLMTLRSIAGQRGVTTECVVVEQSARPEIERELPNWTRYVHTPVEPGLEYCRSATFNAGASIARGEILVLHDNDMIVPQDYAAEIVARVRDGHTFVDLKRFIFYLTEDDTRRCLTTSSLPLRTSATVVQNLRGGSIAATREAYLEIGGFDEEFVGWGGEDLDFWERASAHGGVYAYGYLPIIHLWHPPQKGKAQATAPGVQRYYEIRTISPDERIRRLRARQPP